jgi:hypothetical protein
VRDDAAATDWRPVLGRFVYTGLSAFAPIRTAVIYASDT